MFDDGADCWFPQTPGVVRLKDTLKCDRFCYGAACCERTKAHERAESNFGSSAQLNPMQYEDWDTGAYQIRKSVKTDPDVPS